VGGDSSDITGERGSAVSFSYCTAPLPPYRRGSPVQYIFLTALHCLLIFNFSVKGNVKFPGGGWRGGGMQLCLPGSEGEHVLPLYHDPSAAQLLDDGEDLGEVLHLGRRSLHRLSSSPKSVFYI
jgi:hypothetical protein